MPNYGYGLKFNEYFYKKQRIPYFSANLILFKI